jgi:F-type H+-transporting ATPase subunit a
MADHNPFEASHLIGHVKDADYFEVPRLLDADGKKDGKLYLPQPLLRDADNPVAVLKIGFDPIDQRIEPFDLKLTKFMVLEVVAALLIAVVFIVLARKISGGTAPRGRLWNLLESMLVFLRDEVARPAIGHHDGDKFLPFLWTVFFFVLGCNLLGLVPWAGSATGALATTGALALLTFVVVTGAGMLKMGPVGYWTGQVPHMDLPFAMAVILKPGIFAIEVLGLLIKHFILAMRLLANMMAGHLVLAVIVGFIAASWGSVAVWGVAPASILGAAALSLLELFVAFLQAYIFTFLSALFIGMAVHPH